MIGRPNYDVREICVGQDFSHRPWICISIINKIYISVIQTYDNKIHWHVHSRGVITITAFCNKLNVFCYGVTEWLCRQVERNESRIRRELCFVKDPIKTNCAC